MVTLKIAKFLILLRKNIFFRALLAIPKRLLLQVNLIKDNHLKG